MTAVDDTIPEEKVIPEIISVPLCTYINNTRHFLKNRIRKDKGLTLSSSKTFMGTKSTKPDLRQNSIKNEFNLRHHQTFVKIS